MQIYSLFEKMWYSKKRAEIYVLLHKLGSKPASTIAKILWEERTNIYKTLQAMVKEWLVAETNQKGIKYFFVASKDTVSNIIQHRKKTIEQTEKMIPVVEAELNELTKNNLFNLPPMRFFEWKDGIKKALDDIIMVLDEKWYRIIKFFSSNTLDSQSVSLLSFGDYANEFLDELKKKEIIIDWFLGNGISILETIIKTKDIHDIEDLPAWYSTTSLFVVGDCLYFFLFKQVPICIKITDDWVSDIINLLLKNI